MWSNLINNKYDNYICTLFSIERSRLLIQDNNMADPLVRYFPELAKVDVESFDTKFYTILITLGFFSAIFIVSYFFSFSFHTFKNVLRTKEKIFWCLAFVRGMFGISCIIVGSYYLIFDDTLKKDVVHAKTTLSVLATYYGVGFFIFECIALYTSNVVFRFFDKPLFIHHTLSLTGYCIAAYYLKGNFFAVAGVILEGTTPFTCLCWMLLKADLAHTKLWKFNQIVLVHLFHCRTIVEAYLLFISYYQWDTIWSDMPTPFFCCLYVQNIIQLFLLTPYWTYKKTQQLMKPMDFNHPDVNKKNRTVLSGGRKKDN